MIEAAAKEVPEDIMYEGIVQAHEKLQPVLDLIDMMVRDIGKPKFEYEHADFNEELFNKIVEATMDEAKAAMDTDDKNIREERWNKLIAVSYTHLDVYKRQRSQRPSLMMLST